MVNLIHGEETGKFKSDTGGIHSMIIIYLILICVYFVLPWPVQIIFLIANSLFPDPIPYVDEFMMYLGFFRKISTGYKIYNVLKVIAALAIFALMVVIIYGAFTKYILA